MKKLSVIAFSVLISGCLPQGNFRITETSSPNSFSVPPIVSGNCRANSFQNLLGQNEAMLVDVVLPAGTRIIRTGTDYTRDASVARLNIGVDANGQIVHVACG